MFSERPPVSAQKRPRQNVVVPMFLFIIDPILLLTYSGDGGSVDLIALKSSVTRKELVSVVRPETVR
jgi:hypothetical protein